VIIAKYLAILFRDASKSMAIHQDTDYTTKEGRLLQLCRLMQKLDIQKMSHSKLSY